MILNTRKERSKLGSLLIVLTLNFVGPTLAQEKQQDRYSASALIGYSFNFDRGLKGFLTDSMGLGNFAPINYNLDFQGVIIDQFGLKLNFTMNQVQLGNDTATYTATQFIETIGFGWNKTIGKRWRFSTNLNLGLSVSKQLYEVTSDKTSDFYDKVKSNEFTSISSVSKMNFILGQDVKFSVKIFRSFSLNLTYFFAYVQSGNPGRFNNFKTHRNANFLSFGIGVYW